MATKKLEIIPKISHREYSILVQIYSGPKAALKIRQTIQFYGFKVADQTFYRDMNRLVDQGMATVTKYTIQAEGHYPRRMQYEITGKGKTEVERCREFYKRWYQLTEDSNKDSS